MFEEVNQNPGSLNTISEALEEIKKGNVIIVVDDEERENEGDFVCSAEKITPEIINFMAKYGRGIICLSITEQRADELELEYMVVRNTALHQTPFTISIDARWKTTTGISAYDRANTIITAIDPKTIPEDLARPGHIFPLRSRDGGVLHRAGHTEAAVDLARLAGLYPAGVLCEIMDEDGKMARLPRLKEIAREYNLKIISIQALIQYRRRTEKLVEKLTEIDFPTVFGTFRMHLYKSLLDVSHHLALVKGTLIPETP